jgi:hypothetical protein
VGDLGRAGGDARTITIGGAGATGGSAGTVDEDGTKYRETTGVIKTSHGRSHGHACGRSWSGVVISSSVLFLLFFLSIQMFSLVSILVYTMIMMMF